MRKLVKRVGGGENDGEGADEWIKYLKGEI